MDTSGTTPDWGTQKISDASEAAQIFYDAHAWIDVEGEFKPTDSNNIWKIVPLSVVDPECKEEWNAQRLWMMNPMDGILGDDAMPAICMGCHGKFWGDDMVSIRLTVSRLRKRYNSPGHPVVVDVWNEVEAAVIAKIRANRLCKKCFSHECTVRANPWQVPSYNRPSTMQPPLPFQHIPTNFPNMSHTTTPTNGKHGFTTNVSSSGLAPPEGGWGTTNINPLDCVSKTFIKPDDDV